jgi:hypothetical protein
MGQLVEVVVEEEAPVVAVVGRVPGEEGVRNLPGKVARSHK